MVTLAELRLQARQRADMQKTNFISDAELNSYINNSIAELYDLMCEAYGEDYYVEELEFATDGTNSYSLPDDFYELKRVDLKLDNINWVTVPRFRLNQQNMLDSSTYVAYGGSCSVRYRLVGGNIKLSPAPASGSTVRLLYVPLPVKLVDDTDTLNDFNAYSEYVIVDACIKMLTKEESDPSIFASQKMALDKRIRDKAQNRDAAMPDCISDIYDETYWPYKGVK